MEDVPVNSNIGKPSMGYRPFHSLYGVKGKDNRHTIPFPLGGAKAGHLTLIHLGLWEGGGGHTGSELPW